MTNTQTTATRPLIYLQTRYGDRPWTVAGCWSTERTAYAHLASLAANSGTGTDIRLIIGNPYDGSNPTRILAARTGELV